MEGPTIELYERLAREIPAHSFARMTANRIAIEIGQLVDAAAVLGVKVYFGFTTDWRKAVDLITVSGPTAGRDAMGLFVWHMTLKVRAIERLVDADAPDDISTVTDESVTTD